MHSRERMLYLVRVLVSRVENRTKVVAAPQSHRQR